MNDHAYQVKIQRLIWENAKLRNVILESKHKRSSDPHRPECAETCYGCWARERLQDIDAGPEPGSKDE